MPTSHRMPPSLLLPHERRVNIVVLSTCTPTSVNLIRSLAKRHPISHVFHVTWGETSTSTSSRLAKFLRAPIRSLVELARRKYFERIHQRREQQAMAFLPHSNDSLGDIPTTNIDVSQVNSPAFATQLRQLNPDVLLVSASPILKPAIFEIPRLATLNVHRGIAPDYRGERTLFWALYNRDYDHVGVTLHRINRGIDTGAVLKYGYPALDSHDTEASLTAKSMQLASQMVADALDDAPVTGLQGARQNGRGRCYLAREQRLWKEFCYGLARLFNRRSIPVRLERIVTPKEDISSKTREPTEKALAMA